MAIQLQSLINEHEETIEEINTALKLKGLSVEAKKELKSLLFSTKFNLKIVQKVSDSTSKGREGYTLADIADEFGLTRERIRQIEDKAIKRIRHPKTARKLRQYLYEI